MALDLFPEQRGLASSCQAFVQTTGNAVTTALVAPLVWTTTVTLATGEFAMLALGLGFFVVYLRAARRVRTLGIQAEIV
jgi:DHA1 family bicyclomycin/chloramphenicol resistance-like MFS transporter